MVASWGFYGRSRELDEMEAIFSRRRWFFARVTGRRRIGKTTLVTRALAASGRQHSFYVQVPDSAPAGVLAAVRDAIELFEVPDSLGPWPTNLLELARFIERLVRAGWIVALDEFQYFTRKHLAEFCSHLQATVDRLQQDAEGVTGGLVVLGSLHAELVALLEDRDAPLYNRTTDHLELQHLDVASVLSILDAHADRSPERLLRLWNLFEGVPKFYRDAHEQDALGEKTPEFLRRMFFRSSSPLRTEAENWFLSELRGRYDVVLNFVARNPGCSHGDIIQHVRETSPAHGEQVGGYLKILIDRYRVIEKRQPILAKPRSRSGRYHIVDNFLRSWLSSLQPVIAALAFQPEKRLIEIAAKRLADAEGTGLERLVAALYEERSRKGLAGFQLTSRVQGYWDQRGADIDVIAIDDESECIRFATCKRQGSKLLASIADLRVQSERFLAAHPRFRHHAIEFAAHAPRIEAGQRKLIERQGALGLDLQEFSADL